MVALEHVTVPRLEFECEFESTFSGGLHGAFSDWQLRRSWTEEQPNVCIDFNGCPKTFHSNYKLKTHNVSNASSSIDTETVDYGGPFTTHCFSLQNFQTLLIFNSWWQLNASSCFNKSKNCWNYYFSAIMLESQCKLSQHFYLKWNSFFVVRSYKHKPV